MVCLTPAMCWNVDHLLSYTGPPAHTLLADSSSSCPVGNTGAVEFISSALLDLTSNISHSLYSASNLIYSCKESVYACSYN
jgi:hypothetical protein